MQEQMYKVKLSLLDSTWIWLKLNIQLKTHTVTSVQSQTQIFKFDLSLAENWFTARNQYRNTCINPNYFLSLTKTQLATNITPSRTHVQGETHDFSLTWVTKIQYSIKNEGRNAYTKSNSDRLNFDLSLIKFN